MAKPKPSFMDTIVSLCKRRGFVFPASEIYGGIGNTYDYGPLGVELLRRVKDAWWSRMVTERGDVVGLAASAWSVALFLEGRQERRAVALGAAFALAVAAASSSGCSCSEMSVRMPPSSAASG